MAKVYNRARMTTATAGTGTITLGAAVTSHQAFVTAGVVNNDILYYTIEDGTAWEVGKGTYTTVGTTLSRTLIQSSTGSLLSLSGAAEVFITAPAQMLQVPDPGYLTFASSAGTTTLNADSPRNILVTGTTTHTIVMPDVTTLSLGWTYNITNNSTNVLTIQSSGLNTIVAPTQYQTIELTCALVTGTTAASWFAKWMGGSQRTGIGSICYAYAPTINIPHIASTNTFTAGTNAQGQGAIVEGVIIVTTAANNPSGVTLPTPGAATSVRTTTIINRGANPVAVFPATGGTINTLAVNASITLPVGGMMTFRNSSVTQWWSDGYQPLNTPGAILSSSPTLGVGYSTGSGGAVTQITSRTTGVTLNTINGAITLLSATTTAGTFSSFTVTNSAVAATDNVQVSLVSAATADSYSVIVTAIAAGSFRIQIHNIAAVAVAEAPVIKFTVIKGVSA